MAIRMLQQKQSPQAILSALSRRRGLSRRQAYRYLLQAQNNLQLRPIPAPRTVFTVNLPRPLIQQLRRRCRQQRRPISHVVAEVLQRWLTQPSTHGGS
jgi:hypothetical protein